MAGEKFLKHTGSGGILEAEATQLGGVGSADKIPSLNASGRFDITMMPTGIGADTATLIAVGALSAGDFVNVFNDNDTFAVRKADASSLITEAHGFVLNSFADGEIATVYFEGANTSATGLVPGQQFLSTTAGLSSPTAPTQPSEIVQSIGIAVAETILNFEPKNPILLA